MNIKNLFANKKMLAVGVAVVCVAAYFGYKSYSTVPPEERYKLAKIEKGDLTQSVSANGTVNPVVLVSVGTQVSGTVSKLMVDYNSKVKQGQVLAILEPSLFEAQSAQSGASVKSAQAALDLATANERRMSDLYKQEYVSKQEFEQSVEAKKSALAALELSRAQHKKDKTNEGYTVIKSPVSGVVIDKQIDVGQTVAASYQTPTLFKIAQDLRKMQIDSNFAEADIGKIKVGQEVIFNVDAFANRQFKGVVQQVRLNATTSSNVVTYDVVVSVENPDEALMPGMTAYVNIIVAERKGVLLIPNAALRYKPEKDKQTNGDKSKQRDTNGTKREKKQRTGIVYILENGVPKGVKVELGITDNKFTEVVGGELKEGDNVITDENKDGGKNSSNKTPMRMF
jgi:HlyD family secretion protein